MIKRLHVWVLWRFGRYACDKCGLILINNPATARAARAPCKGSE